MLNEEKSGITGIIAFAIEKPENTSLLSEVFGRSNFFYLYSLFDNSEKYLPNPFTQELGGAGIQSAQLLINENVEAVITRQIGRNPFRFLLSANIKVYQCGKCTATEALEQFRNGKLIPVGKYGKDFSFGRRRGKNKNNNTKGRS